MAGLEWYLCGRLKHSYILSFIFTSYALNMFRTLIHLSSGACDFSIVSPEFASAYHTETPTHIETRTHNQCGDTIENSQAPDYGCINVRNMFSIEEVK